MPSIKRVAEVAGVSVGAVSHVITGSVPFSGPLRLKVPAALRKLNYHPNHLARGFKANRTRTLGIMVPHLTISFFSQVIRGAEAASRKSDYSAIAVNSDDDGECQKDLTSLLRSQRVEGTLTVDDEFTPATTTVVQPAYAIDFRAPGILLDRINGVGRGDTVTLRLPARRASLHV